MSAKENILKRLREAADQRKISKSEPDQLAPIYLDTDLSLADWFKENLEKVSGEVIKVKNLQEAGLTIKSLSEQEQWKSIFCLDNQLNTTLNQFITITTDQTDFLNLQVSITGCEYLVAHLGSTLICSAMPSGRRMPVYAENHIVIAHEGQLVSHLTDALNAIKNKYHGKIPSSITNITGPSRTADIEKTLIKGMHGPKRFIVILCEQEF